MACLFLIALTAAIAQELNSNALKIFNSFTRNCEIVYISETSGYGVRATKDIQLGESIMIIPPNYLISIYDSYPWSNAFPSADRAFRLIPRLLYEKFVVREKSNLKILIDALPKNYSNYFTFNQEEKDYFDQTYGKLSITIPVDCVSDYQIFVKQATKDIKKCEECMKEENFFWACQVVLTRSYIFLRGNYVTLTQASPALKENEGSALIFGVDMFNHGPKGKVDMKKNTGIVYVGDPRHISVRADRNTLAGEEIFFSYGAKRNFELLLMYGFVLEKNSDDIGMIAARSENNDCAMFDSKEKICRFVIQSNELSVEMINYLFYRMFGIQSNLKEVSEMFKRDGENFSRVRILGVIKEYRTILMLSKQTYCIRDFRVNRKLLKMKSGSYVIDSLNRLCHESHIFYQSHQRVIDSLILETLLSSINSK